MVTSKTCKRCGETKTAGEFYKNKRRPDGLQTYCIDCTKRYQADRVPARSHDYKPRLPRTGTCQHPDGCDRPVQARGLCALHANRWWRTGKLGPAGTMRAASGAGSLDPKGYRVVSVDGKRKLEHRYVMELLLGRPLERFESVHHKNGQRADNRPLNLELWVKPQIAGQRVEDLVRFVVDYYSEAVRAALKGDTQLKF